MRLKTLLVAGMLLVAPVAPMHVKVPETHWSRPVEHVPTFEPHTPPASIT